MQNPHPIERNSEQAVLGGATLAEAAEVSQTSMGNQMQSGIMLGRRNGDNIPGTTAPPIYVGSLLALKSLFACCASLLTTLVKSRQVGQYTLCCNS